MRCLLHYGPELAQYLQSYRAILAIVRTHPETGEVTLNDTNLIASHEPTVTEEIAASAATISRPLGTSTLAFELRPSDTTYIEYVLSDIDDTYVADAIDLDDILVLALTSFARLNLATGLASLSMRLGGSSDHICEARVADIVEHIAIMSGDNSKRIVKESE